ncbi:MAG: hypothetical protein FWD78_07295 [Treponema sp.]|nr:hypothetical protein [Treponema sp.]
MKINDYLNPASQWRAKPFWALNDELDADEIRRQINIFREMGFGGYFMHSRVGLKTPFLGDKWFEMIKAGIDESKKTGMETWLYDEDRWPSGIAGGYVTMDHRCRVKRLHCLRTKGDSIPTNAIAVFRAEIRDGCLVSYQKINPVVPGNSAQAGKIIPGDDEDVLAFCVQTGFPNDSNIGFYNGTTYIDTLSKQTVARFIDVAYKPYLQFRDEFGKGIKGIFTDEPNRSVFLGTPYNTEWERQGSQYQIPWTTDFAAEFERRMGYGILDRLPEVFFNRAGEIKSKVRYDTAEVTAQLFLEAYIEQISRWCGENGLTLTGHFLGEDDLYMLSWGCGVVDRFYESMQAPGIDLISGRVEYMVPKQVQSAARQFGKKWTMCEMYAHSGWGYSLQQYKSYGEWNTVFGINLRCPHLSLYSLAGQRKRDCPPDLSFQQAWHRDYKAVEDHFARLGMAVTGGAPLCSLLVIHPVDAVSGILLPGWAAHRPGADYSEPFWEYEKSFKSFTRSLMGLQIDFDVSEEAMIEKHGRMEKYGDGVQLVIGQMRYRCVAVPPLISMRRGIAALLSQFAASGGRVVFIDKPVSVINFADNLCFADFPVIGNSFKEIESEFSVYGTVRVNGDNSSDILAMHRRGDEYDTLLLVNTRLNTGFSGNVNLQSEGQVQIFNTLTCERLVINAEQAGSRIKFSIEIPKGGSALFFIVKIPEKLPAFKLKNYTGKLCSAGPFNIELDSPNILLLDRPHFSAQGGPEGTAHILQTDTAVRNFMGLEKRSNSMYQPWFKRTFLSGSSRHCSVKLEYSFEAASIPAGELYLCLEQPEHHTLIVNGKPLEQIDCGYLADKCIRKLRLENSLLIEGLNTITSICDFDEETDLEAMYLLGDFGVTVNGFNLSLVPPVRQLWPGDITKQGLPFYAGSVKYNMCAGEPGILHADNFRGIALRLYTPGREPLLLPFEPYEAEVQAGNFTLELICSMGNALGIERHNENGYPLEPQGLMSSPAILV